MMSGYNRKGLQKTSALPQKPRGSNKVMPLTQLLNSPPSKTLENEVEGYLSLDGVPQRTRYLDLQPHPALRRPAAGPKALLLPPRDQLVDSQDKVE